MGFGFRFSGFGLQISGFGLQVLDFGFRISCFGARISVLGVSGEVSGSRGLGFSLIVRRGVVRGLGPDVELRELVARGRRRFHAPALCLAFRVSGFQISGVGVFSDFKLRVSECRGDRGSGDRRQGVKFRAWGAQLDAVREGVSRDVHILEPQKDLVRGSGFKFRIRLQRFGNGTRDVDTRLT